jgi:hypothetical protein
LFSHGICPECEAKVVAEFEAVKRRTESQEN